MKKNKGLTTIAAIIISLLVIGGGIYLYTDSNKVAKENQINLEGTPNTEESSDTNNYNVDTKKTIELIYPNSGDEILFTGIIMAGDLHFRWITSDDNYIPTEKGEAFLIDSSGNEIRNREIYRAVENDGIFMKTFVGEKNIIPDAKYKIKICDYVEDVKVCDTSDGYFDIISNKDVVYPDVETPQIRTCENGATNYPRCNSDLPFTN